MWSQWLSIRSSACSGLTTATDSSFVNSPERPVSRRRIPMSSSLAQCVVDLEVDGHVRVDVVDPGLDGVVELADPIRRAP